MWILKDKYIVHNYFAKKLINVRLLKQSPSM